MNITFSVIIPMYNASSTIERCINSVLAQTYPSDEIIIVDDCSNDNSTIIVEHLIKENPKSIIKLITLEKNIGPAGVRNFGVANSKCTHLAFLDSDDYWLAKHLEYGAKLIEEFGVDTVVSGTPIVSELAIIDSNLPNMSKGSKEKQLAKPLSLCTMIVLQRGYCTPSLIVARKVFNLTGGFPRDLRYAEDFELFLKLRRNVKSWYSLNESTVVYGKHLFASGAGLSSKHWKMFAGSLVAVRRALCLAKYDPRYWALTCWFVIKYLRRLFIIVFMRFRLKQCK